MNKKIILSISILIISISLSFTAGFIVSKSIQEKETNKNTFQTTTDKKTQEETNQNKEQKEDATSPEIKYEFVITYEEEVYSTKTNQNVITTENKRKIPSITNKGKPEIAQKIQKSIIDISDKEWNNNIKSAANDFTDEINNGDLIWEYGYEGIGVDLYLENIMPTPNILVFNMSISGSFGGVGWFNYWGYNYDTTTGDLLTLRTITSDYNELYSIIKTQVDNTLNEIKKENEIYSLTSKEMEDLINQHGNWMFTETGIDIVFQKYDIADGATGAITVSINKSLINDLLKDKYKF